MRFSSEDNTYYAKQNPAGLTTESVILKFLREIGITDIPSVVCENSELNAFIMDSCGKESLRTKFNGNINILLMKSGISLYCDIQRICEKKIDELLSLDIPDWRLNKLPCLYGGLVDNHTLLLAEGLSELEIKQLDNLKGHFQEVCCSLDKLHLPETLSHCDFHENNILININTNQLVIIDWPETVIAHPFFSLASCLWNTTYFSGLKEDSDAYREIQKHCVQAWLDIASEEKLLESLTLATKLSGVYAALGYLRLYNATDTQEKSVSSEKSGSIAGCFRTFLKNFTEDLA